MAEPIINMFEQGGWVLGGIVVVSAIAWSLILCEWLTLTERTGHGWGRIQRAVDDLQDGRALDSATMPESGENFIGRLLRSNVISSRMDRSSFEAQVMPLLHSEVVTFDRTLRMVAVLAASLPLLGLLGTVLGMIHTFDALTDRGVTQVDALAGGISEALITTQAGLVIAVPILLVNRYLGARIRRYLELSRVMMKKIETAICHEDVSIGGVG